LFRIQCRGREENGSATIRGFPPETTGSRFLKAVISKRKDAERTSQAPNRFRETTCVSRR
jgi:hypothetical protein